ncbi:MAG: polysaccharide biosynthesis tyrosine autokinase [Acidimicrobiales bacterium]
MLPREPALPAESEVPELRDYLAVVRRRKKIVAATVVVTLAAALALSFLQAPVYQADVEILLQSNRSEKIFSPEGDAPARADPARVQTEIGVMESRSVRRAVAEARGHPFEVDIEAQGETDLITLTAESTEPAEAALRANTYAEVYIETRRQQLVADLQRAIDEVQAQLTDIDAQLDQPFTQLDAQIAAAAPNERLDLQSRRADLEDQLAPRQAGIEAQRSSYVMRLNQLQVAANLTQTGGAQIVSEAVQPASPVRPNPRRNALLGAAMGLVLGVGLAFLREYLDDTIKTKDDLQSATGGLPVLGLIPAVGTWKDHATAKTISITQPGSEAAEAYRSLRTATEFIGLDRPIKVIQVTSPNASEGKTTTLANLGVALARAGRRVIAVSCDLRRPRLHDFLGLPGDVGFTSVLVGEASLSAALQWVPDEGRLALLASGPAPPNPSELLASARTSELLGLLRDQCDVLLIDSPPLLPVTDALVLAGMVDATILVGTANRTSRREIHRSVELLNQVNAPLVGTVLNGADPESTYGARSGYGYRSSYAYGSSYGSVTTPDGNGNGRDPGRADKVITNGGQQPSDDDATPAVSSVAAKRTRVGLRRR